MAFKCNAKAVSRCPEIGQKTYITKVRVQHGLMFFQLGTRDMLAQTFKVQL